MSLSRSRWPGTVSKVRGREVGRVVGVARELDTGELLVGMLRFQDEGFSGSVSSVAILRGFSSMISCCLSGTSSSPTDETSTAVPNARQRVRHYFSD